MKMLKIEFLTREAFAPFGDVIELEGAEHFFINAGATERYHDLAHVDVSERGGRPMISLFRSQACELPFEVKMLERHPLGSQAIIPLHDSPYLIVAARGGGPPKADVRAFVTRGWQGINYARGIWHHPLLALETGSGFIVVDRGGEGVNLEERALPESLWLTSDALRVAA